MLKNTFLANPRIFLIVVVSVLFVGLVLAVYVSRQEQEKRARAASQGYSFEVTGLDGAGFQNAIAVSGNTILSAADVSGINRSIDGGVQFAPSNDGISSFNALSVATIQYHPTVAGKAYMGTGRLGGGGGLYISTDDGKSWVRKSTVPQFSGGNNNAPLPGTHPRSTGNLLAIDATNNVIYAGTFNDGLMRSTDDGATWQTLGLSGKYIRSIALDPADTNTLYVAVYGDKVWKTTTARTTGTFTQLTAAPTNPEELIVLNDVVYMAAGEDGIFMSNNGGSTWTNINRGTIQTTGPNWMSIAGFVTNGVTTLYVGCDSPANTTSMYKSTDGGASWLPIMTNTNIHNAMGGSGGPEWWLYNEQPSVMPGKSGYVAAHIIIDKTNPQKVYVAGRSGIWASSNGGQDWYPFVDGLSVTINRSLAVDPNSPDRVYVANTDWIFLASNNNFTSFIQKKPQGVSTMGIDIALDTSTTPSTVVFAAGNRDNNTEGEIYTNPDPLNSSWVNEGLEAVAGGKRPLAVAVGQVNNNRVILAAVDEGGVWRKANGTWTQVSTTAMSGAQNTKNASLAWPTGSNTVYLYDRASGVWRSNDAGVNWTQIWTKPSNAEMTGFVAVDPATPSRLFVTVNNDGVYKLENANTGTVGSGITPVEIGGFDHPGPIAVAPSGRLWATELVNGSADPAIKYSDNAGSTFVSVEDDFYIGAGGWPYRIASGSDQSVLLALNGNGVIRGIAAAVPSTTAAPATPTPVMPASISATSTSSAMLVGEQITVDVVVNGGGQAFNAAQATVSVSPNLTITSLFNASTGSCNFTYSGTTPSKTDPSFAGAILGSSSDQCIAYRIKVRALSTGAGTVTITNGSVKAYSDNSEILGTVQNASFPITEPAAPTPTSVPVATATPTPTSAQPTPTRTPTPLPSNTPTPQPTNTPTPILPTPAVNEPPAGTYGGNFLLQGIKNSTTTSIYINGSTAGVTYPTATSWQVSVPLNIGSNTFSIYGRDSGGNQSEATTIAVKRNRLSDIDGDNAISLTDLSLFAADWGKTSSFNPLADMDTNGVVNLTDFSILAKQYGQ